MGREGSTNFTRHFTKNADVQNGRRIILKVILELMRVACQLDSTGSVYRISENNTLSARAMLSIYNSETAAQIILPQCEQCGCSLLHTILYRS
jgi:hypothetical protein